VGSDADFLDRDKEINDINNGIEMSGNVQNFIPL
jgi:hypothetical protein